MDTATPRTDSDAATLANSATADATSKWFRFMDHSKELERELIASAERVARLEAALQSIAARSNGA